MAITTTEGKLSVMEMDVLFEPGLPMEHNGSFSQGEKQHFIWGFSDVSWLAGVVIAFVADLNTRLLVYLRAYYTVSGGDLSALATRYMNGLSSGDRTQRFKQLISDATDAMS